MGKVLVEKLLRACPVKKIYVLIRPKKGVEIQKRLDDMLSFEVSQKVRAFTRVTLLIYTITREDHSFVCVCVLGKITMLTLN